MPGHGPGLVEAVPSADRRLHVEAVEVSAARAKRRLIAWARYTLRHPACGPRQFCDHRGYAAAWYAATRGGRHFEDGPRQVWEPNDHGARSARGGRWPLK